MKRKTVTFYRSKKVWGAVLSGVGMLLALYIFQVNDITALAYQSAQARQSIQQFEKDAKYWESAYASTLSFKDFGQIASDLRFTRVNQVQYVRLAEPAVAQNR